ncbi:MAG: tetratricopeptide repeat protein [candidate division WOR-3 bacterium]|nr:tetratricopeptide repeat protein [candidate division WOR-3 bacterium]
MEYFDGLPESEPAVRAPFEKGRAAMAAYKWDEAIQNFEEAEKHAAGTELAALHGLVGHCHHMPGRLPQALASFEESARLAERFHDKPGQAHATDRTGVVLRDQGKLDRALEKYEEALRLAKEAGARPQEAYALGDIGVFHYVSGEPAKALSYYEDALKIHRETGDRHGQASLLCNIGLARSMSGEQDKALEYCEKSLALAREIGEKGIEAGALANIDFLRSDELKPAERLANQEQALKLMREVGDKRGQANLLANMGATQIDVGEHEKAVASYVTAQNTYSVPGTIQGPERYRHGLGRCLTAMGREKFVAACAKSGMAGPEADRMAQELANP